MRTGFLVMMSFPVIINLQGVPCKPYRVWVCSEAKRVVLDSPCTVLVTRKIPNALLKSNRSQIVVLVVKIRGSLAPPHEIYLERSSQTSC